MKNIYLLDTNIISQVINPQPNETLLSNIEFHTGTCCISSITWYELQKSVALLPESPEKTKLQAFLIDYVQSSFSVIPYDIHAASINADISSKLSSLGKSAPVLLTQIASIAIANNLILVTDKKEDFNLLKENFNLMVEEWN